mmetsp:Transcript_92012/g.295941  ORF Transcript_92012/g.295941 Transcript_92012/m.295941 type:complete len:103 (+) Transcript_92012:84-392(+)
MSSFSLVASLAVCGWGYRLPFVTKDKYAAFDDALAIDADQSVGVEVAIGQVSVNESPLFNADRGWEFRTSISTSRSVQCSLLQRSTTHSRRLVFAPYLLILV